MPRTDKLTDTTYYFHSNMYFLTVGRSKQVPGCNVEEMSSFERLQINRLNTCMMHGVTVSTAGLTTYQLADEITYNEQNFLCSFTPGLHVPPAIINKYTVQHYLKHFGKILLDVWCFSCDFTNKPGRHIELNAVTVEEIIFECQRILFVCKPYGNKVKVVFLECPFSSIGIWNLTKCGSLRDPFINHDKVLQLRVENLNSELRTLNEKIGVLAPKFSEDLKKSRKSNKAYETEKISFSLLDDGIHPSPLLSEFWIRRLINTIIAKECF